MRRLPPYHVPRPRLTERCAQERLVLVEAAGGYGKTVLSVELVDSWEAVGIEVALEAGGVSAALLASRLRAAVARAGFIEAADAAADAGEDHVGAVDAMLGALAGERAAIVVDDAHHADPGAAVLIDHIAAGLVGEQRLVVLARQLPEGAQRLRRAEFHHLDAGALALRTDETLAVCRNGFGLAVGAEAADALERATGGWTAATVLAAARAQRTGEAVEVVAQAADRPHHPADTVAALLEEALVALGAEATPLLAQLARLPLLDRGLVDLATASEGFFDRALAAGLPFVPARGAWFDLPGPVRDHLGSLATPAVDGLLRAAHEYARRDELGSALQLLLAAGEPAAAAELLADAESERWETLDVLELSAVFERLPAAVVDAHPWLLYKLASGYDLAAMLEERARCLERAGALAAAGGDAAFSRALDAERANDLVRDFEFAAAEALARQLLVATPVEELRTRARTNAALGRALCWQADESGRRDPALDEGQAYLLTASALYRALGMRSAEAGGALYLAMWIEFARGQAEAALERLTAAAALLGDRPYRRALTLGNVMEVLRNSGATTSARPSARSSGESPSSSTASSCAPTTSGPWRSRRPRAGTPRRRSSCCAAPSRTKTAGGARPPPTSWPMRRSCSTGSATRRSRANTWRASRPSPRTPGTSPCWPRRRSRRATATPRSPSGAWPTRCSKGSICATAGGSRCMARAAPTVAASTRAPLSWPRARSRRRPESAAARCR